MQREDNNLRRYRLVESVGSQESSQITANTGDSGPWAGYRQRREADRVEGEDKAAAIERQFDEESLNRGYGLREIAPIRREVIRATKFRIGYVCGMLLAIILGLINASQAVNLMSIVSEQPILWIIVVILTVFSLVACKAIASIWLIPLVGYNSYSNKGEEQINRWMKILGPLFFLTAIPSIVLRMDLGLPEVSGLIYSILWEFVTVLIAALAAHAATYYSWSTDLAKQHKDAQKLQGR